MRIPIPFKDLLPVEAVKQLSQLVAQPALVSALKDAAQKLGIKDQLQASNLQQILQQAGRWMESVSEPWLRGAQPGLTPGINATGELFSNRWCTHRMCADAIGQVSQLSSHYAETTKLDSQLRNLLIGLTSAQAVLVVPNLSIALYLAAVAHNSGVTKARWVLPRVDCVRMPLSGTAQGGNIRAVLDQAGAHVFEIGTNQDCTLVDFEESLREPNSNLLLASPNSLSCQSHKEHRNRAIAAAKNANAKIVEILMDGSLHDLSSAGISARVISECWNREDGIDVALVPGDAFLGGPECGVIFASQTAIDSMQKLADVLGCHASCSTKAALLRTLQASESFEQWSQLPVGTTLTTNAENLSNRASRLATQLAAAPNVERAEVQIKACRIGAGVWSGTKVESSVIQLYPKSVTASVLAEQLAAGELPIWGNVQSDHVELVMRSIEPDEDRLIVKQMCPSEPV